MFHTQLFARALSGPTLLLFFVIAAYFNVAFLGQTLIATGNSNPVDSRAGALRYAKSDIVFPAANWHDQGIAWWQWEPAGEMWSRALRHARIPLWDPQVGGGVDSHVNLIQTQYYPPYILLLLAGDTPGLRDLYYLLQVFAAGLFCYLFLRNHGFGQLPAVFMGLTYMLGGPMTQNVNSILGQSFAVLPMMVFAVDRAVRAKRFRTVGWSSLLLGVAGLSSYLPAVVSGYLLAGLYVATGWIWDAVEARLSDSVVRGRRLLVESSMGALRGAIALALSLLLLGFLLIPVELAARQDKVFSAWYPGLGLQHYSLDAMLSLVSPAIGYGSSQAPDGYPQLYARPDIPVPFYLGLIPILSAVLVAAGVDRSKRKILFFFAAATIALFFKLVGAYPVQWLGLLPVFRDLHFIPYFCAALGFGVAGIAALGVDALLTRPQHLTVAAAIFAAGALTVEILRFAATHQINPALQGAALWGSVSRYGLECARVGLLTVAFLTAVILRRWFGPRTTLLVLLGLALLDLASVGFYPRRQRNDVWKNVPPYVRFLQSDPTKFRVFSPRDMALPADTSEAFGVDVLSSRMAFNSSRYSDVIHRYFEAPPLPYPLAFHPAPGARRVVDVLNAKYAVIPSADEQQLSEMKAMGFQLKLQDGPYGVFENPTVWDRAYLANSAEVIPDAGKSLAALSALEPGGVILDEKPQTRENEAGTRVGSVDDLTYDFDRISLRVNAVRPALLVLDENFSPGWKARVDGKAARILRANYAFQAVEVPAGQSRITFTYTTPGLYLGAGVSCAGLLAIGCLLIWKPSRGSSAALHSPDAAIVTGL